MSILTSYSTGELDITDRYEGRVSLEQDIAKGVANLKLSSISLLDNRLFECRVSIPKDDKGQLADTTHLVVLGKKTMTPIELSRILHHKP